jgi:hypothetical protein
VDMYSGKLLWQTELPCINYTTGQNVAAAVISMPLLTRTGLLQLVSFSPSKSHATATASGDYALWVFWSGAVWKLSPQTGVVILYQLQPSISPKYYDGAWYINNYPQRGLFSCVDAQSFLVPPYDPTPNIIWRYGRIRYSTAD